jgi:hypothetical protein
MKQREEWKCAERRNHTVIFESLLVAAGISMVIYRAAIIYRAKLDWITVVAVLLVFSPKLIAVFNDLRRPGPSARLIALYTGIIALFLLWFSPPAVGCDWGMVVAGYVFLSVALIAARWNAAPTTKKVEDDLHRMYFADRLADIFNNPKLSVQFKRIAITGDWGAGKTRVLDLIAQRLTRNGDGNYLIGRVNPWKANNAEEAWAAIAAEIDRALGYRPWGSLLRPKRSIFDSLLGFLPAIGISGDVFKLISAQGESSRSSLMAKINARLKAEKGKVVVLVDDMERTDPKVLVNLFPVIDQMAAIENAAFIFAIDPSQVAKAYDESARNDQNTKGYLDKVFDLQIELPDPRPQDIYVMLQSEARKRGAERLVASLPHLERYLPFNPRAAFGFLGFAVFNEHCFLSRYRTDEKPYPAIFHAWLAETEFPGILDAVLANHQRYLDATRPDWTQEDAEISEVFKKFADAVQESLKERNIIIENDRLDRAKRLLEGLCAIPKRLGDSVYSGKFSIRWAKSEYKQLMTMSSQEVEDCHRRWTESARIRPIMDFLAVSPMARCGTDAEDWKFVDKEACARQVLKHELDLMFSRQAVHGGEKVGVEHQGAMTQPSSFLVDQLRAALEQGWEPERQILDWRFLQDILERPEIDELENGHGQASVYVLACELVKCIPLGAIRTRVILRRRTPGWESGLRAAICLKIFEKVRDSVKNCLRQGDFASLFERGGVAEFEGWGLFISPRTWLPATTPEEVSREMELIVEEAARDQVFAAGCAWVVAEAFMKVPDAGEIWRLEAAFSGYVTAFWRAAMKLPKGHEARVGLFSARESLMERAPQPDVKSFMISMFPDDTDA